MVTHFILLFLFSTYVYYVMSAVSTNNGRANEQGKAATKDDISKGNTKESMSTKENVLNSEDKIPNLISRREWGAKSPRIWPELKKLKHPVPYVLVSYFKPDMSNDILALQVVQRRHQEAGQPDIQSNFMIGGDGKIYEGRGWDFEPAESIELPVYNGRFIEISYIGDFNDKDHTHPVIKATWKVLEFGRDHNYLDDNFQILSDRNKYEKFVPGSSKNN